MPRYGAHHRDATTAAVRISRRYVVKHRDMTLVIGAIQRAGRADQLLPQTMDEALARTLAMLAATVDPTTDEGAAILSTAARTPKALGVWIRRNRARVQQILDARKAEGPPP